MPSQSAGLFAILLAYAIWGLFPLYWRLLAAVDATELLLWRLPLTAIVCWALIPVRAGLPAAIAAWRSPTNLKRAIIAGALLSGNWLAFIWAVNKGRILESSLGYFLCPIVSVALGRLFLGERLPTQRWIAVAIAVAAVILLLSTAPQTPWAALVIATTWGAYGLTKKQTPTGPITSLGMETSLLSLLAVPALAVILFSPQGTSLHATDTTALLALPFAGILTASPLLLFAFAAQRIPLATMGIGQFIVPSAHFALGIAFGEHPSPQALTAFAMVAVALILYATAPTTRAPIT